MKINYFVSATKRENAPIYVRLSAGRKVDLIVKTGLMVDPTRWSNATQTIKQRITTDADNILIKKLKDLKDFVHTEFDNEYANHSKEWLLDVIYKYHNKKSADAKTLNDFIYRFIKDAEAGERMNRSGMKLADGSVNVLRGFKHVFDEYQGIYSEEQLQWHKDKEERDGKKKPLRPLKKVDFDDVNIDFYQSFVKFLSEEGYKINTQGRFIRSLKMFMRKSLDDKLHNNREFMHSAFRGLSRESFSVYLTNAELEKICNLDLTSDSKLDIVRDAFITMCETALRVSDYKKVDVNIRTGEDGMKLIYITQTKTKGEIVIPCSARLSGILEKYNGKLPRVPDQYINRGIKIIARMCNIDEVIRWEDDKYSKTFETQAQKWKLISCHTGRRSACTNMYLAGIPTISIMQISGHRTEESFLKYIKITPEQNARKLAEHPYFTKLHKVG
jgi:hypothetical protein